jgi:hypothetical protein
MDVANLLSVREFANETGRPEYDIRYMIRMGRLKIVRVGSYNILIPKSELQKLEDNGRAK